MSSRHLSRVNGFGKFISFAKKKVSWYLFAVAECVLTVCSRINPWSWVLLEKLVGIHLSEEKFPNFMEPEALLPLSPMPTTGPYPEPNESNPHPIYYVHTHFSSIHPSVITSSHRTCYTTLPFNTDIDLCNNIDLFKLRSPSPYVLYLQPYIFLRNSLQNTLITFFCPLMWQTKFQTHVKQKEELIFCRFHSLRLQIEGARWPSG